jgi:hypothetical protein
MASYIKVSYHSDRFIFLSIIHCFKMWRRTVACSRAFKSGAMAALNASITSSSSAAGSSRNSPAAKSQEAASTPLSSLAFTAAAAEAAASPLPYNSRRSLQFMNATSSAYDDVRYKPLQPNLKPVVT